MLCLFLVLGIMFGDCGLFNSVALTISLFSCWFCFDSLVWLGVVLGDCYTYCLWLITCAVGLLAA